MTRLVLHLGQTKTGTTTLQASTFPKHPDIFYLGKYIHHSVTRGCRNDEVFKIVDSLLWNPPKPGTDLTPIKELYEANVEAKLKDHKVVVGSWESNANSSDKKLGRIIDLAQHLAGDCALMFTLRNPATWLTSEYLQRVQGNYYRRNREGQFGGRPFMPFDEWAALRNQTRTGLGGLLRCAASVRTAAGILGKERVGVFVFEQLCADPETYYGHVADWLGVDQQAFQRLASGSHSNRRLRQSEFERIQQVAASEELTARWSRMGHAERIDDMRQHLGRGFHEGASARISLGEGLQAFVRESTSESLRWVADQYKLPLEDYGYNL